MKRIPILFLVLLIIPAITRAQLKGGFCHNFGFGVECITFFQNNEFEYSHNHCTGNDKGKGVYTIKNGKLMLQFQTDADTANKVSIERSQTNSDSITIDAMISTRETGEPLIGAMVFIKDKQGNRVYGTETDMEGHCFLKVPSSLFPALLMVQYISYANYSQTIEAGSNYKMKIALADYFGKRYTSADTMTFSIRDIKKRSIWLKGDYNYSAFEKYEKGTN